MKKLLEIAHRMDDYACMWNGVEDLYIRDTGETLPPKFFYVLSGFGSFCYMKTPKAELKRMVALGDGRTRQMYEFLAPIVDFDYKICEYIVDYLTGKKDETEQLPLLFSQVADIMKAGFETLPL